MLKNFNRFNQSLVAFKSPLGIIFFGYFIICFFLTKELESNFIIASLLLASLRVFFKNISNKIINTFLLILIVLLMVFYNFNLSPEFALSFLVILFAMKFLQIKNMRDYHITLHTILLLAVSSIMFLKDLYYILFIILFSILVFAFFSLNNYEKFNESFISNSKNILKITLYASPLFIALFLIFPRYRYFFPSINAKKENKIGYSATLKLNNADNLTPSSKVIMQVESNREFPYDQLYWRGRSLSITDGFNWNADYLRIVNRSKNEVLLSKEEYIQKIKYNPNLIKLTYRPFEKFENDVIVLETLSFIQNPLDQNYFEVIGHDKEINQSWRNHELKYSAYSTFEKLNQIKITKQEEKNLLKLPLMINKKVKLFNEDIASDDLYLFIHKFKNKIVSQNFKYSLNPGKMINLSQFLDKKIGFCGHYASLLGVLLRINGFPSRIVTGFQGGKYNNLGKFYTITSSDAHVWVEAYYENKWHRIDPTSFIGPDRIIFGGQEFYATNPVLKFSKEYLDIDLKTLNIYSYYISTKKILDYLNYKTNTFFDNFNIETQKSWAKKLGLKIKEFFIYGFVFITIIFLILFYYFKFFKRNKIIYQDEWDKGLQVLNKSLSKININTKQNMGPLTLSKELKLNFEIEKIDYLLNFLDSYSKVKFENKEIEFNFSFKRLNQTLINLAN